MGDTGSLALGGLLGTIAVATKHEIVLAIIGGLFVLEAVSVIVQVVSFKLTGKRVFLMAPIHHHFEQTRLDRAADRDPLLDHRGRAGAGRPLHAEAAMIPDPGHHLRRQDASRCSASAARASRARRRWSPAAPMSSPSTTTRRASRRRRAAGIPTADLRQHRLVAVRRAGALARRAADASGAALDGRPGAQRRRRDHRRHRAVLPRAAHAARRMRRSSPSPAPTASRPPRR